MSMPHVAIDIPKEQLRDFCRKWKVTEFALFGSVTRDDFRPDSDVDVMVRFAGDAQWSLFDIVTMENQLGEIFDRPVDLCEREAIEESRNRYRRESILSGAVQVEL
jgi:predicted nucleotidyltransferase